MKQTLRNLAEQNQLYMGTCVSYDPLVQDTFYREILAREFNILTPENAMKFQWTEPEQNKFNFKEADKLVEFAVQNKMKIRGHTLVWHQAVPPWVKNGKFTKKELMEILHNHIRKLVQHYKGRIYCWDVVNEAFETDGSFRHSLWYDTIGPDYIEMAFQWAHEADPDALLFYNDYDTENLNPKSDAIYSYLKKLKEKDIPIDGIGFQCHILDNPDIRLNELDANFKRFAGLGFQTDITEIDVSIQLSEGTLEKKIKKQSELYAGILKVCRENTSCKMFVLWGFTDKYTWVRYRKGHQDDLPCIFDEQYQPKPIFNELKKIIIKNPP